LDNSSSVLLKDVLATTEPGHSKYALYQSLFFAQTGADPNVQTRKITDAVKIPDDVPGIKPIKENHAYLETALHVAIRCQHYDVVQTFLEHRSKASGVHERFFFTGRRL